MPNVAISSFTVPANTVGVGLSGYSLTGSNAQSMFDLSGTWNTSGTPTALKLNITDTASNAASLLMDLQVGGSSRFKVTKDGAIRLPTVTGSTTSIGISDALGIRIEGDRVVTRVDGTDVSLFTSSQFRLASAMSLVWNLDTALARDAANTLAQRNGVNAQTFRVYNTFTDASNYERGYITWSSNVLKIGMENAGTGLARAIHYLQPGTNALMEFGANNIQWKNNSGNPLFSWVHSTGLLQLASGGQFVFTNSATDAVNNVDTGIKRSAAAIVAITNGSTGGGSLEMQEVTAPAAPATNGVRIYAEDNGSGKTRLMALFATGAAVQIAIEP